LDMFRRWYYVVHIAGMCDCVCACVFVNLCIV